MLLTAILILILFCLSIYLFILHVKNTIKIIRLNTEIRKLTQEDDTDLLYVVYGSSGMKAYRAALHTVSEAIWQYKNDDFTHDSAVIYVVHKGVVNCSKKLNY